MSSQPIVQHLKWLIVKTGNQIVVWTMKIIHEVLTNLCVWMVERCVATTE